MCKHISIVNIPNKRFDRFLKTVLADREMFTRHVRMVLKGIPKKVKNSRILVRHDGKVVEKAMI